MDKSKIFNCFRVKSKNKHDLSHNNDKHLSTEINNQNNDESLRNVLNSPPIMSEAGEHRLNLPVTPEHSTDDFRNDDLKNSLTTLLNNQQVSESERCSTSRDLREETSVEQEYANEIVEDVQNNVNPSSINPEQNNITELNLNYQRLITPQHNKSVLYSDSYYVPSKCHSKTCPCKIQDNALGETIKNLPSNVNEAQISRITKKLSSQAVSWVKTIYECAPCYRSCCKMIATINYLYVIGGANPNISERAMEDVWRFNVFTRRWKRLDNVKNIPSSLISYSICYNNSHDYVYGYLFGGAYDCQGLQMSNKLYKFNIDEESNIVFEEVVVKVPEKPSPRCGSTIVIVEDKNHEYVYVSGGSDGKSYLFDLWRIDTKSDSLNWEKIPIKSDIMLGRYTHEAIYYDQKIISFGGGTRSTCFGFNQLDVIDLNKHQLVSITTEGPHPSPRKFHSVVQYYVEVYVIGGWTDTSNDPILSDEVWKLDLTSMKWSKCSTRLKMPHFYHASAINQDGCLYIFGGCIDKSMYPSNKLQRAWMKPPKLQYLSMFRVLSNNPKLANNEEDEIRYSETIKMMRNAVKAS